MSSILFVVKLQNNKYYLGLSNNLTEIFNEHLYNKYNIEWMNLFKPLKILSVSYNYNYELLNNTVIEYMNTYGIENVRGGSYSNVLEQY